MKMKNTITNSFYGNSLYWVSTASRAILNRATQDAHSLIEKWEDEAYEHASVGRSQRSLYIERMASRLGRLGSA